jgi:hypothetical protein
MKGINVCYHHGGKSRRGFVHPNYKHGFYCKKPDLLLIFAFYHYKNALRKQQAQAVAKELIDTMPMNNMKDYRRIMAAFRAGMQHILFPKLTPKVAAELRGRK